MSYRASLYKRYLVLILWNGKHRLLTVVVRVLIVVVSGGLFCAVLAVCNTKAPLQKTFLRVREDRDRVDECLLVPRLVHAQNVLDVNDAVAR